MLYQLSATMIIKAHCTVQPSLEATDLIMDFSFIGIDQLYMGLRKCDFKYPKEANWAF